LLSSTEEKKPMFTSEPNLAPLQEIVRYLAMFERMFEAMDSYFRAGDKDGILLGGWLADALHNVPDTLWNCTSRTGYTLEETQAWLINFVEGLRRKEAPERILSDAQCILSSEHSAAVLGLRDDLTDVDLAPLAGLNTYLYRLYYACVELRAMINHGNNPLRNLPRPLVFRPKYKPWDNLESVWTSDADELAASHSLLVAVLRPLPQALVKWSDFDAEGYEARWKEFLVG
jgi:hypothetical protein